MEKNEKQFLCTGNCLNCSVAQRAYCSCQHIYNSMRMMQDMKEAVSVMAGTVEELKAKIEALQNNEAEIFCPNEEKTEKPKDKAQEGDGDKE